MTALSQRLTIDLDMIARRRSVDTVVHILRDFIPDACFRDAIHKMHEAFERDGIELTSAAMRKEYEAWKSITLELPKVGQ